MERYRNLGGIWANFVLGDAWVTSSARAKKVTSAKKLTSERYALKC